MPANRARWTLARRDDALANRARTFAAVAAHHIVERHARDFDLQIDAVEQRSRELADVLCDHCVVAAAFRAARAAIAARTRIHRRDELKARRIRERSGSARNGHRAFLERLPHHLDRAARELGQLVEKEHAVVRERDLARLGERAAADERGLADRVMRKPKRPCAHDAGAADEQSGDAVDLRDLERFVQRHRRQNRRQTAREHRLAAARRPDEQEIVSAGRGDFERALWRRAARARRRNRRDELVVAGSRAGAAVRRRHFAPLPTSTATADCSESTA